VFGSAAIDVIFGLVFVYLTLSLICSALNETIASVFAWRADLLREGIQNLLNDSRMRGLALDVYDHPLVESITRRKRRRFWRKESPRYPSYLSKKTFALALLDRIDALDKADDELRDAIEGMPEGKVQNALRALVDEAAGDAARFRAGVERWFDEGMERVSGWYRRRVQLWLWIIAIVLAFAVNADTFRVADTLWNDDALRQAVVDQADRAAGQESLEGVADDVGRVSELAIPVGWSLEDDDPRDVPRDFGEGIVKLFGLLITAAALTFGAPFWFDLLKKVAQVRSSGSRPARSEDEPADAAAAR
jgi:hypothetical protein